MIGRMRVLPPVGCVAFAGLILLVELDSAGSDSPVLEPTRAGGNPHNPRAGVKFGQ
jgi:hypothetical protein